MGIQLHATTRRPLPIILYRSAMHPTRERDGGRGIWGEAGEHWKRKRRNQKNLPLPS